MYCTNTLLWYCINCDFTVTECTLHVYCMNSYGTVLNVILLLQNVHYMYTV